MARVTIEIEDLPGGKTLVRTTPDWRAIVSRGKIAPQTVTSAEAALLNALIALKVALEPHPDGERRIVMPGTN
jgi:hypothetical protein